MTQKFKFLTGEEFEVENAEFIDDCMGLKVKFVLGDKTLEELTAVITNTRSLLSIALTKLDDEGNILGGGSYGGYWGSRTEIGEATDGRVDVMLHRVDVEEETLLQRSDIDFIAMERGVDL